MRILWLDMSDIPWDNHILKAPFKPKIIFDEFKIHEHVEEGGNEVRENNRLGSANLSSWPQSWTMKKIRQSYDLYFTMA